MLRKKQTEQEAATWQKDSGQRRQTAAAAERVRKEREDSRQERAEEAARKQKDKEMEQRQRIAKEKAAKNKLEMDALQGKWGSSEGAL